MKISNTYKRLLIIFMLCILSLSFIGCGSNESEEENITEKEESISEKEEEVVYLPSYTIVSKDDVSTGIADRYSWRVAVHEEVTIEDLKSLSKKLVEVAKEEHDFNAIIIGYFDYEEYAEYSAYTLGKSEYAPDGEWAKAGDVKAGDYNKMEFNHELYNKDWSKQLTEDEVQVYEAWNSLYYEEETPENLPEDEIISNKTAEKFDITSEEVEEILNKQMSWTFNKVD